MLAANEPNEGVWFGEIDGDWGRDAAGEGMMIGGGASTSDR